MYLTAGAKTAIETDWNPAKRTATDCTAATRSLVPTGIASTVAFPISSTKNKSQSVKLDRGVNTQMMMHSVLGSSLEKNEYGEEEPGLVRREEVDETSSGVIKQELKCLTHL